MISVDYFLYDNRTLAQWGRDWGLKAATGVLANRSDLRKEFDGYCGAVADQGRLSGFSSAVGGLRSRNGYLLCITLKSSDYFGRPGWALFGLWCPDGETLQGVLTGDPVGTLQALLGAEPPPRVISFEAGRLSVLPTFIVKPAKTVYERFQDESTPRAVLAFLLGSLQSGALLPNVLGITSTSRLSALSDSGFDIVYSHPRDDSSARALARHHAALQYRHERFVRSPMEGATERRRRASPSRYPAEPLWSRRLLMWLSLAGIAGIAFVLADQYFLHLFSGPRPSVRVATDVQPDLAASPESPQQALLARLQAHVAEFRRLDPEALRKSESYSTAANVPVGADYAAKAQEVRDEFSALLKLRNCIVRVANAAPAQRCNGYVAYYFDEQGRTSNDATRVERIQSILKDAGAEAGDCRGIHEAFGFEFDDAGSVVSEWCDAAADLQTTFRTFPAPSAPAKLP